LAIFDWRFSIGGLRLAIEEPQTPNPKPQTRRCEAVLQRFVPYVATYLPRLAGGLFPDLLWRRAPEANARTLYLTFDDGPTAAMTDPILRVLDRFDARATCFLVGAQAEADPERVRRIRDAGHTVGNHTFTHPDPWHTPDAALTRELERTTDVLSGITGAPVQYLRPPYGRFTRAMRRWANERGRRVVMWDVMPGDFLSAATQSSVERFVMRFARGGSVVVLHDNPIAPMTPAALETVLRHFSERGWRFAAL
jgi:peptidoglycan/xylan/chitin deacetylase (PgdA/CDA1 family)